MEYVQKAIELAREQRKKKAGEAQSPLENGASQALSQETTQATSAPQPVQVETDEAVSISYQQSRQVELNPKTLLENRIVAAFDNDLRGEPYRQLRTQLLKQFKQNNWRTLAVTSAHQGAGKTLTAINIAIAIAKEVNQTVLLVDLDFKGPSMVEVLGFEVEAGFVEYLNGEAAMNEVMINPGLNRLTLLPALPVAGPTSEILSSPKMKATLKELVDRYPDRLIIYDLPPLLRDDDALVFTPYVDATLLVVEQGVTLPYEVERCNQLLHGTSIIGTIFNKAV
jgi:protein-tyrosine kinase